MKADVKNAASGAGEPAVVEPGVVTSTETNQTPRLTPQFKVLIHNDDVTPMDFVVYVLIDIFKKELQEAMDIMLLAHNSSVALVTVLPLEQAELRVDQAHSIARTNKYPLTFTIEPA
ncbi:MAG TPA: ATP-dependent Clp protease adaptor ClpS [Planctomycetota bacterium]|nr:ATP-dependent Clp protease adaptor ClpS [Planctomycetota bacterium]